MIIVAVVTAIMIAAVVAVIENVDVTAQILILRMELWLPQ